MSNEAALQRGTQIAKDLIARHVLNKIFVPAAKEHIQAATQGRIFAGHNMTGNTINSYAAGVYVNGQLVHIETSAGSISKPLRRKLGRGKDSMPEANDGTARCRSIRLQRKSRQTGLWRQNEALLSCNPTNRHRKVGFWLSATALNMPHTKKTR